MFKYLGQHIFDFVSQFRNDVYFKNLTGSSDTTALVVDADGKVHTNSLGSSGDTEATKVRLPVRFQEAVVKGDPVYISGYNNGQNRAEVAKADCDDFTKMPSFGLADATYSANDNGFVISIGNLADVDTQAYSVGDTLYVASGGGLTNVKPTVDAKLIQNVGVVTRSQQNSGQIEVVATGRTNDVPWPLYVDVPNSKVGIGTTSPSVKLEIGTDGGGENKLRINSDVATKYLQFESLGNLSRIKATNAQNLLLESTGTGGYITFNANSAERMRILYDGKVGIGTTSPVGILHAYSTSAPVIESPSNAAMIIRRNDNTNYSSLLKYHSGNSEKFVAGLSDAGDFTGSTGEEYIIGTTKTNPLVVLKNDGKLGIGTTSPSYKVDIDSGTANAALRILSTDRYTGINFTDSVSNTNIFYDGQEDRLYTAANFKATRVISNILRDTNNNSHLQTTVANASNTATVVGNSATANTLTLGVKIAGNVVVPNGNVGIGTTNPTEKLHVEGNAFIKNNLHVEGDLTIGKISNNSALLDVGGNFNFDTVAEVSTTDALNFVATIQNVAGNIDNGSHTYTIIYKTADGGETGAYNSVLFKTITIVDNTTAGQVQLTGIPTSPDPRVIARDIYRSQANQSPYYGKKLATINDNTTTTYTDNSSDSALDQNTLFYRKANSTAGYFYKDNNLFAQAGNAHYTSFGVSALESVTIGQDNVAFGGSALQNTTTGKQNTAVGYSTGVNNTTGYDNTYLGYVAGYNNETGQRNTAVGSFALRQATLSSASYNTAVGRGALWKLTSNNNHNTALDRKSVV